MAKKRKNRNKIQYYYIFAAIILSLSVIIHARINKEVATMNLQPQIHHSSNSASFSNVTLEDMPDGFYVLTNKDRDENDSFLIIAKKGNSFIADGILDIEDISKQNIFKWSCATGYFKGKKLLFNDLIEIEINRDTLPNPNAKYIRDIPLSEINTEYFLTEIEAEGNLWNKRNYAEIGLCSDMLPRVSNRLRVVDSSTGNTWNLSNLLPKSNVQVIPLDSPNSEPVLEMPITTGEKDEYLNGRFSSKKTTKGDEKNLSNDRQYFLRATLSYEDNVKIDNAREFLGKTEGCAAPSDGKTERVVVRDSKPFTLVKKGELFNLIHYPEKLGKIQPWGNFDASNPSGKAAFDRAVLEYRQNVHQEIMRRVSQSVGIDFPPPLIMIHGILDCFENWKLWTSNLSKFSNDSSNISYPQSGIITFTPTYDYWVKGKWNSIQELKLLRDKMASDLSNQIASDVNPLLLWDSDQPPPVINIIAHSNGGVIARPLSKIKNKNWQIKRIYTLGSPHSGTLAPFGNDFGLSMEQMFKYNCIEGGFNSNIPVSSFAGMAYSDWLVSPGKNNSLQPLIKSFQSITGSERFNDGAVYPHGSTFNIVCGSGDVKLSVIQKLNLINIAPLYHSPGFPLLKENNKNFLDIEGFKLFKTFIASEIE